MRMYAIQTCRKKQVARNCSNPPFSRRHRALSTWHRGLCLLHLQDAKALSPRQDHYNLRERQTETCVGLLGPDLLAPVHRTIAETVTSTSASVLSRQPH